MQADLFAVSPAPADPPALLQAGGRTYRTRSTDRGLAINWTGPGATQGVVGQYHPTEAAALAAVHHIEAMRKKP